MKVKWYGQASFLITSEETGTTIITDPYTPETAGYQPITDSPDIIIISSDNDSFHCRADLIPGNPEVVNALEVAQQAGRRTVKNVDILAIAAMEALNHIEHDPDQNGMYRFTIDGITVGHMGDIGNALSNEQINFFRGVDVLLALAGGHPTLELDDLKVVIDATKPKLVVPMHFRTLRYKPRNVFWIENFLSYFDESIQDFVCDHETSIVRESLPDHTRIVVLDHAR